MLTSSGQLYAFGNNYYGALGNTTNNGAFNPNPTPALVTLPGATGQVINIAAGESLSLVLTSSGQLYAFGWNRWGQLGSAGNNSTGNPNPIPAAVAGMTVDTMASGAWAAHTLAVVADLAVTSKSLLAGRVGTPYGVAALAEGGMMPYSWQASGLPAGLSIDPVSGEISGIPSKAGTTQVTLTVSDGFGIEAKSVPIALTIEGVQSEIARPTITKLGQSHRRWREGRRLAKVSSEVRGGRGGRRPPVGTTFTFNLNEVASVSLSFARRKGKPFKKVAAVSFKAHRGTNRVSFQGRVSHHRTLRPGRYRLTATASAGGSRSKPKSLSFTIVP